MEADLTGCDADKLLWHFSFGANMGAIGAWGLPPAYPCFLALRCSAGQRLRPAPASEMDTCWPLQIHKSSAAGEK